VDAYLAWSPLIAVGFALLVWLVRPEALVVTPDSGGDTVVMFKDSPAARAFITYLASPEASTIWAKRGGFTSPNKKVPLSAYSDALTRASAKALVSAKVSRFDLSDLEPAAFGATTGQGEWKIFQDFLKNPKNVSKTAAALESSAAKAFK